MNIASLFAGSGAFLGLLVASALFFTTGSKAYANRILALTLIACSAYLASLVPRHSPELSSLSFLYLGAPAVFLFGPALYLYVSAVTRPDFRLRGKHLMHAVPYALILLDGLGLFAPLADQSGSILASSPKLVGVLYYLLLLAYLGACLLSLAKFRERLQQQYSSVDGIDLRWLSTLIITCLTLSVPGLIFALSRLLGGLINWPQQQYSILLMMSISYLIAFYAITRPTIFNTQDTADNEGDNSPAQYQTSTLTSDKAGGIWQALEKAMRQDKLYLQNQLKIGDLASAIHVPSNHLSQTINQYGGCSFFDYINNYRVEAAKRALLQDSGQSTTMLDIAMASGFNSESVFYKRFKKHTHLTPRQFQDHNTPKSVAG